MGWERANTAENSIPRHTPADRPAGANLASLTRSSSGSQAHAVATAFVFGLFLLEVLGHFVLLA